MSNLVDSLRQSFPTWRSIAGELGFRRREVYLQTGTWESTGIGDGSETQTEVQILENGQNPKVREVNDERRALGEMPKGSLNVGPITPVDGTPIATLESSGLSAGQTTHLRIYDTETGGNTYYEVTKVDRDRALRVMLTAEPVR